MRNIIALALVMIWPAATSHVLLETLELIHVVHDAHHHPHNDEHGHGEPGEQNSDNHRFADGDYTATGLAKALTKPEAAVLSTAAAAVITAEVRLHLAEPPGPAPPGATPHLLQKSWHFSLRAALPVRAPSFIS